MLLAILDFARIASALAVVVGVTSHLGSRAALSPRRCRIASVGASNRTLQRERDATIARSAAHPPSTSTEARATEEAQRYRAWQLRACQQDRGGLGASGPPAEHGAATSSFHSANKCEQLHEYLITLV